MSELPSESVNLIVTSPPYPMIEMWDELFSGLNPQIGNALNKENGMMAYKLMNEELNKVWKEINRVLAHGGIACINIGDATRKIGNTFQLYSNHSRITHYFEEMGFKVLPVILWRKGTNKPTKYMGSGMLPPSAYVTLEHEYILIFRRGDNRRFSPKERIRRQKSAFFWEERNLWFSDIWNDLRGISQELNHEDLRDRSAAFPFELAYRLINMYSIQGDVVLDPFAGTGTTMLAAMCTARNSIAYELEQSFKKVIDWRVSELLEFAEQIVRERIEKHLSYIEEREKHKGEVKYISKVYGFKVISKQETNILFPPIDTIRATSANEFEVKYQ
jgi:DNA modification methylase